MHLESLANELLLDLFEFFTSVDLFRAFAGLNSRFDTLLITHCQSQKCLDFRSVLKHDFDVVRKRYLRFFVNRITSLCLSDDDSTPQLTDLLLSRGFALHRFTHLQSLSLFHLRSKQTMDMIIADLPHLSHLTRLKFISCYLRYDPKTIVNMMDSIWRLPNLTHCHLDISFEHDCYLITPTVISLSLEHLSIVGIRCSLDHLTRLHENTPCLQYLNVDLWDSDDDPQLPFVFLSMITLKLTCQPSRRLITTLLQKMPNLEYLTVETKDIRMDGRLWEQIIVDRLRKLKVFQLKMQFELVDHDNMEQEVEQLIDTYRSRFWIDEHKWFVRCYWNPEDDVGSVHLHTLPYNFDGFEINVPDGNIVFKSTSPCEDDYCSYNFVRNLHYCYSSTENMILSRISFSNIQHLTLTLPHNDCFQSVVPRLDNLISLEIRLNAWCPQNSYLPQLQVLLDRAPRLYSLKFASWTSSTPQTKQANKLSKNAGASAWKMPPFQCTSSSVRQLDLRGINRYGQSQCFNNHQCATLIRSPLGIQCEVLVIEVENRTFIIDLVNKMVNLRALNVRCRADKSNEDELSKWLRLHLPSSCKITKDTRFPSDIRLWIR